MRNALFIVVTLLGASVSAHVEQPAVTPQSAAQLGARRPPQKNPYAQLFEVQEALQQAQQVAPNAAKKTIVCGMTIIEADPNFDARMRLTPPADTGVRYTIRAVDPPICNPARK